jgi:uncharacterized glyoxalase superfamily protein PhnB
MAARKKTAKQKTTRRKAKAPRRAARPAARRTRRKPETLRLRTVTPSFTVNDVDASIAWYRDVLGCVVEETWTHEGRVNSAMLRTGSVRLHVNQDDWKKGRDRRKGEGVRLFCTTVQDIDALAAQIKERGGRLTHEPMDQPWGTRDFGVIDPDGYKLTIASHSTG